MALQGTLDTFALADLVRLLATTSKTGELAIDSDRGSGRLWFSDGQLVGGEPAADDLDAVVFALLRMQEGDFVFHADGVPDDGREPQSALDVLAAAEARLEEWLPVEDLVPSPAVALTLRGDLPEDEVIIGRDVWRRLVAIGGGTTAGAFGDALGLDEQATGFAVRDLVDAGLVEVGDEVTEPADEVAEAPVVIVAPVVEIAPEVTPEIAAELVPEPVAELVPEPVAELAPEPDVAEEPAEVPPVLGVVPDPPYSFGRWGEGPVPEPDAQADPAALGPWEPLTAPALVPDEAPTDALPPPDDPGSYAVDLDSQLGGMPSGHSYLGTAEPGAALPEPLLGTDVAPAPEPHAAEPVASEPVASEPPAPLVDEQPDDLSDDGWTASPATSEELGVPLDSLSPAAARALAAAASADADDDDTDAGRRVLRRIISTGKG